MILTYCEALYTEYDEVMKDVRDRINIIYISIHYFEYKRIIFSEGLFWDDFLIDIFECITKVDSFDLFSGMGKENCNYPA